MPVKRFINFLWKDVFSTKTFRRSILTISATVASGVLGLLFYMVVARNLGPSAFGIFAVSVAVLNLIADIGDVGTDTGLIRFVGKYAGSNNLVIKFLKLAWEVKMLVWLVVLITGWIVSEPLSIHLFNKPELTEPLRWAFLGVGGVMFLSFSSHGLQALQRYKIWSLLLVGSNTSRIIVTFIVIFLLGLNLQKAVLVYITIPFVFFGISLLFLPNFIKAKNEFGIAREFFQFNRWIFMISIIAAATARMDTFLATRLVSIEQVGIYSVAAQLTSFIPQFFFAIATVAAPKLAAFKDKRQVLPYLWKLQFFCLGLALIGFLGIPIAYFIIPNFYGVSYVESFKPFVVLYLAQLIFLIALPSHQAIFYFFAKPAIFVWVAMGQFLLVSLLAIFLIPQFGIMGAALSVLAGNLFNFVLPLIWVILKFKND